MKRYKVLNIQLGIDDKYTKKELREMDFRDSAEITWCQDRINETDIKYILAKKQNIPIKA
jgi:hypothetical protein